MRIVNDAMTKIYAVIAAQNASDSGTALGERERYPLDVRLAAADDRNAADAHQKSYPMSCSESSLTISSWS